MATSQAREEICEETFYSPDELDLKFDMESLPSGVVMIRNHTYTVFVNLCTNEKPTIQCCMKLYHTHTIFVNLCTNEKPTIQCCM